jgi:outer membrane protein assembly factor BamB
MFRGPANDGISSETRLPLTWGPDQNIKWKAELSGTGNGSPIVSAGRVFVTTASDEGKQRTLHCFDRRDGKLLWSKTVSFPNVETTHKTNPYAATTPAADGHHVVVWHGSAGLFCYDFTGQQVWSRDLGEFAHIWGYGSSPVIHRDRVFLNCGPGERSFMAAVALRSGEVLWKIDEPGGASGVGPEAGKQGALVGSWSTPLIAKIDGRDQVLCSMPTRVVAYDPDDGKVIWYCEGLANMPRGNLVYTSLVVGDGIGVAMGGYTGPAIGFKLGGYGDVTKTNQLWRVEKNNPQRIGSGVLLGKYLYMANAGPSVAECIDAGTGEELWRWRLPGGNHWGSIVAAGNRLYTTDQSGTTQVFAANPEKFELLASNALGEPTNATPAPSDGEIFIRTTAHLFCIAESP